MDLGNLSIVTKPQHTEYASYIVSPGSNPPLLPFGRLGIFLLSIDAPVDSAV